MKKRGDKIRKIILAFVVVITVLLSSLLVTSTINGLEPNNITLPHKSNVILSKNPDEILLKSRQFIPQKGLEVSRPDKKHFLIQFEKGLSKGERKAFYLERIKRERSLNTKT